MIPLGNVHTSNEPVFSHAFLNLRVWAAGLAVTGDSGDFRRRTFAARATACLLLQAVGTLSPGSPSTAFLWAAPLGATVSLP